MKGLDYTALILTITGAINWGLVGLFKFDLVAFLFGNLSWLSRIIYLLVGLSGLYLCTFFSRQRDDRIILYEYKSEKRRGVFS